MSGSAVSLTDRILNLKSHIGPFPYQSNAELGYANFYRSDDEDPEFGRNNTEGFDRKLAARGTQTLKIDSSNWGNKLQRQHGMPCQRTYTDIAVSTKKVWN